MLGHIASKQGVLILGGDRSGDALAHMLFLDLNRKHGFVPLLLNGAELKSANDRTIIDLIYATFKTQYYPDQIELYKQLEPYKEDFDC